LLRVAAIGGVGVVAQTLVFEILAFGLGVVRPSTATLIGAEFGIITNFLLNNRYSFNDRSHAPLPLRLVRFHLVIFFSVAIQWFCVFSAESMTADPWFLRAAYASGILLGFLSNYTGYRLWVWKHHEKNISL
jgi:putative flippase GtrA